MFLYSPMLGNTAFRVRARALFILSFLVQNAITTKLGGKAPIDTAGQNVTMLQFFYMEHSYAQYRVWEVMLDTEIMCSLTLTLIYIFHIRRNTS